MKTLVALAVILGCFCALAQASAIKRQENRSLKECSAKAFLDAMEDAIDITFTLWNVAVRSWETFLEEGLQCTHDLSDLPTTVSCVGTALTEWTETFYPAVEQYYINATSLGVQVANDLYNCCH